MNIGTMNERTEDGSVKVTGKLRTYSMALDFKLVMRDSRRTDDSPSHDVYARGKHGEIFLAGVAWQGNVQSKGTRMYTIALTIPELFEGEQKLVAWERDNEAGSFDVQFSKTKETTQQQASAA